jgi:hypothetical protein
MVESSCADTKITAALKIMYNTLLERDLLSVPEKSSDKASMLQFNPIHPICAALNGVVGIEAICAKKLSSVGLLLAQSYSVCYVLE